MLKITKAILAMILFVSVVVLAGCESTTHSKEQQAKKYARIMQVNNRMMTDDFDRFFMLEGNSRLGRWHTIVVE